MSVMCIYSSVGEMMYIWRFRKRYGACLKAAVNRNSFIYVEGNTPFLSPSLLCLCLIFIEIFYKSPENQGNVVMVILKRFMQQN